MIDPRSIEGARPPDDPVHLVPLGKQQLCQIRAVLPGDPCNQCALHARPSLLLMILPSPNLTHFFPLARASSVSAPRKAIEVCSLVASHPNVRIHRQRSPETRRVLYPPKYL